MNYYGKTAKRENQRIPRHKSHDKQNLKWFEKQPKQPKKQQIPPTVEENLYEYREDEEPTEAA